MRDMLAASFLPPGIGTETLRISIQLFGYIIEHRPRRNFVHHESPARMPHHAKLDSKAELVMFSPADFDLQPVRWR